MSITFSNQATNAYIDSYWSRNVGIYMEVGTVQSATTAAFSAGFGGRLPPECRCHSL